MYRIKTYQRNQHFRKHALQSHYLKIRRWQLILQRPCKFRYYLKLTAIGRFILETGRSKTRRSCTLRSGTFLAPAVTRTGTTLCTVNVGYQPYNHRIPAQLLSDSHVHLTDTVWSSADRRKLPLTACSLCQ